MPDFLAPLADVDDVRLAYEGNLPDVAEHRVDWLIDLATARLKRRRPNIVADVASGAVDPVLAQAAVVNAVLRVFRAPGAFRSESAGEYSYTLNTAVASGAMTFTDDELADCTPASAASTPASRAGVGSIRTDISRWRYP